MGSFFLLPTVSLVCRRERPRDGVGTAGMARCAHAQDATVYPTRKFAWVGWWRVTTTDRLHRAALYRRSPMTARGARATPGSLQWVKARRIASPSEETTPTDRPEFYTREAA